jgi:hypothetical protein
MTRFLGKFPENPSVLIAFVWTHRQRVCLCPLKIKLAKLLSDCTLEEAQSYFCLSFQYLLLFIVIFNLTCQFIYPYHMAGKTPSKKF